ncbi:MAG: hypothetical protein CBD74_07595 [Saprospirales bacterium TMED214]|nr:MAG: hypothetical protein CBD74_07595 [Saprospirales bacterium TMED214]
MKTNSNEESIFREALGIVGAAQRATYLDEMCGEDTALRTRLAKLLLADESDWTGFDRLAELVDQQAELYSEEPIRPVVENYAIQDEIGQGGMAVVYLAEQVKPFQRKVALKIQRTNQLGSDSFRRFAAEQRTLAKLNHINIATIYNAGSTSAGNPYVAMEWVDGLPITTFCNNNRLTITERLKLFRGVCDGMEYAHHNSVIHRDLKPANILVAETLQGPIPKIIDFGIAKNFAENKEDDARITRESQIIGTLQYMSPEQASGDSRVVDFHADIFALGVMLHELLIDEIPLAAEFKAASTLEDSLKCIRETVPRPLSVTLKTLPHADDVAQHRKTSSSALKKEFTTAVDFIVSRMLEKESCDRYQSIQALKEDLDCYLAGRPIPALQRQEKQRRYRRRYLGWCVGTLLCFVSCTYTVFSFLVGTRLEEGGGPRKKALSVLSGSDPVGNRMTAVAEMDSVAALSGGKKNSSETSDLKMRSESSKTARSAEAISPAPGEAFETAESMGMRFRLLPPGTFEMGRGTTEHQVTLTKPFKMGIYEVTQAQYEQVMGENPSSFIGPDHPVEGVSWNKAAEFCHNLSALPAEKAVGNVYRLPTEAEWEYACRAGKETYFSEGDSVSELGEYAWYDDNAGDTTHPVGRKKANAWGFYDMRGNVWEWVEDWWDAYPSGPIADPTGPESGKYRIARGGGWNAYAGITNATHRSRFPPSKVRNLYGFRVVLELTPEELSAAVD